MRVACVLHVNRLHMSGARGARARARVRARGVCLACAGACAWGVRAARVCCVRLVSVWFRAMMCMRACVRACVRARLHMRAACTHARGVRAVCSKCACCRACVRALSIRATRDARLFWSDECSASCVLWGGARACIRAYGLVAVCRGVRLGGVVRAFGRACVGTHVPRTHARATEHRLHPSPAAHAAHPHARSGGTPGHALLSRRGGHAIRNSHAAQAHPAAVRQEGGMGGIEVFLFFLDETGELERPNHDLNFRIKNDASSYWIDVTYNL
jgi:hypothetical protein